MFSEGVPLVFDPNQFRNILLKSSTNFASAIYAILNPAVYATGLLGLARTRSALLLARRHWVGGPFLLRSVNFAVVRWSLHHIFHRGACPDDADFHTEAYLVQIRCWLRPVNPGLVFDHDGAVPAGARVFGTPPIGWTNYILLHGFAEHVSALDGTVMFIRDIPPLMSNLTYYVQQSVSVFCTASSNFLWCCNKRTHPTRWIWGALSSISSIVSGLLSLPEFRTPSHKLEAANPRNGVFTTFWGPAYIDFGLLMVPYAFLLGIVIDYFRASRFDGRFFCTSTLRVVHCADRNLAMGQWICCGSPFYLNIGLFLLWLSMRAYNSVQA